MDFSSCDFLFLSKCSLVFTTIAIIITSLLLSFVDLTCPIDSLHPYAMEITYLHSNVKSEFEILNKNSLTTLIGYNKFYTALYSY